MRYWVMTVGIGLLLLTAAACGTNDDTDATPAASSIATAQPVERATPPPAGPAPSPGTIDAGELTVIDEWRSVQVPMYPGAERADFKPEAQTQVQNGGTMAFRTAAPPEQVIAFYRAALPLWGWTEERADAGRLFATRSNAALVISVTAEEGVTRILMILSDA